MKFGQYLQENLTPEWRRAYIDYRGCKKRIKAVSQRINNDRSGSPSISPSPATDTGRAPTPAEFKQDADAHFDDGHVGATSAGPSKDGGAALVEAEAEHEAHVEAQKRNMVNGDGSTGDAERSGITGRSSKQPADVTYTGDKAKDGKSPALGGQLSLSRSPRLRNKWKAAMGHEDSSDDDLDHGPAAPPRRATSTVRSKNTPSLRGGSSRTPKSPQSAAPGSKRIDAQQSATMSPRSPLSPGMASGGDQRPTIPPFLDIGEPSVAPTPRTRTKGNTVEFASSPESPEVATVPRQNPMDAHIGQSPAASSSGNSRGHSQDERDGHESDADTPLTGATSVSNKDASRPGADGGRSPPGSPRSPLAAFQALVRKASRSDAPNSAIHTGSPATTPAAGAAGGAGRSMRSMTLPSPYLQARTAPSFDELYKGLEPDEKSFFDFLDSELEKVESFYLAREAEAMHRGEELRAQLRELAEHRRIYHSLYGDGPAARWEGKVERILPSVIGTEATQATVTGVASAAQKLHLRLPSRIGGSFSGTPGHAPSASEALEGDVSAGDGDKTAKLREAMRVDKEHKTYNPERYTKYKSELRKAVLEYYRSLEIIKNYRIMNVTGFRKALKKFEKATRIHCLEMYTDERISFEAFATGKTIEQLLRTAEDMFSTHFEHGDIKKARDRLRKQDSGHTHYTSVFRSGMMIGIGLPIAIVALVEAVKDDTHRAIPPWDGLMQVYGALFLPVIFAILFELNLAAYVANRINYSFVMELSRPVLDFRSYLEIPSFLFFTLSVCMYFSFLRIGAESVAPTSWPAGWLVFVAVFFLNPLPIFRRHTRYWFLRVLWRVITPGWSRVEFIAFFVADELNSLVYSMSNILFLSCAYANRWPDDVYGVCPSGSRREYIALFALPPFIRLVQCLKRWHDSQLKIHLINAGKYCSSILQYSFFVWWRSRGSRIPDNVFIAWVIIAIISSTYNTSWDFMVDWALFKPGSRSLRPERGYPSRYIYYFAVVTNVLIRFVWVWYIPARASHVRLRSFFFAMAEMLRRWQWNFFRVETEHLGNADAYRVTREIPLPYRNLEQESDEEAEGKSLKKVNPVKTRWKAVLNRLRDSGGPHGHMDDPDVHRADAHAEESGAEYGNGHGAGHDASLGRTITREYEARRPGDSPVKSARTEEVEDKWLSLVKRLRERKRRSAAGQEPSGS